MADNFVTIGWENWAIEDSLGTLAGNIDATLRADPDNPIENALNGNTFEGWAVAAYSGPVFQSNQWSAWSWPRWDTNTEFGRNIRQLYFGLAAHNLASQQVRINYFNWTWAASPSSPRPTPVPIGFLDSDETYGLLSNFSESAVDTSAHDRNLAIAFGTENRIDPVVAKPDARIGVMRFGPTLQIPRSIYAGHDPIRWNEEVETTPSRSLSGNFLGNNVVRRGRRGELNIEHIPASFIRSQEWSDFAAAFHSTPFFLWWRPDTYPDEVEYCWADGNNALQVRNTGPRDLMSIRMRVRAFSGGWKG